MVRDLNALSRNAGFTDNPNSTARRNWRARWESNPRLPNCFGCSIAVELREDQMDKWRDRAEALHAGNRTRTANGLRRGRYALLIGGG